jgi:hypothetical protein
MIQPCITLNLNVTQLKVRMDFVIIFITYLYLFFSTFFFFTLYLNQACHGLSWLCIVFFFVMIYRFGMFVQKKTYAHKDGS